MDTAFGDLGDEWTRLDVARVVILPIPYERTTSYVKGTGRGPGALLEASTQLELYDEELECEPHQIGIHTAAPVGIEGVSPSELAEVCAQAARRFVGQDKWLVGLGGEHTVSLGLVRAHKERYPGLNVLQLDAHADLRDTYEGSPYSHACVARRLREIVPTVQVGIRSLSREEAEAAAAAPGKVFMACRMRPGSPWVVQVLEALSREVYLTIDLDFFNPSVMPSVGFPEPGGFGWDETMRLLRVIFQHKNVVGCDVVELCPQEGNVAPDFLAAKLVYKLIGYRFHLPGGVS